MMQQIGEARHVYRVEHVDFEEDLVPDIVSKERHSLDEGYMTNIERLPIVSVSAVRQG